MALRKNLGGVQDLTFGMSTEKQYRAGEWVLITQINAAHIPYSTTDSMKDKIDKTNTAVLVHMANENNPHMVTASQVGASPIGHTHTSSDISNLDLAISNNADVVANTNSRHDHTNKIVLDVITGSGQGSQFLADDGTYKPVTVSGISWGNITGNINNQTDLVDALNLKANTSDVFVITDYIDDDTLDPSVRAGKPIVLNGSGVVDTGLLDFTTFNFVGEFTPQSGSEYPTSPSQNDVYLVSGVDETNGYTFTEGDLNGRVAHNYDFMIFGTSWSLMTPDIAGGQYYQLDGSVAITAPFAGGGQQFKNASDGTDDTDLATVGQITDAMTNHTHTSSSITDFDSAVSSNSDVSDNTANRHYHSNIAVLDVVTDTGTGDNYLADDGTYKPIAGGSGVWGSITGDINNQTDLMDELNDKASLSHTHNSSEVVDFDAEVGATHTTLHSNLSALENIEEVVGVTDQFLARDGNYYTIGSSGPVDVEWSDIGGSTPMDNTTFSAWTVTHKWEVTNINGFQDAVSTNTNVSANTNARHSHSNEAALANISTTAGSTNFLAGDGLYKPVTTSVQWGDIGGTLSAQADLQAELNSKPTGSWSYDSTTNTLSITI